MKKGIKENGKLEVNVKFEFDLSQPPFNESESIWDALEHVTSSHENLVGSCVGGKFTSAFYEDIELFDPILNGIQTQLTNNK